MNNSDKRAEELFYRVALHKNFPSDVESFRKKYGIPVEGFLSEKEEREWRRHLSLGPSTYHVYANPKVSKTPLDFDKDLAALLKKYKLPYTLSHLLKNHIFFNNKVPLIRGIYFACAVASPYPPSKHLDFEQKWKDADVNFVRLLIHDQATKESVKEFVDHNWNIIQRVMHHTPDLKKTKRIRIATKKERDSLIFDQHEKIINHAIKRRRETTIDNQIATILSSEYGITVTSDNIRKIIQRQRKLRGL